MSNEELVAAIQSGENERMGELWEQVEKFIAWKAHRIVQEMDESPVIDIDDLVQSGYFALVAAVRSYKAGGGPFTRWLSYYLKTAFAATAGYRTAKMKNDPMRRAFSMDYPIGEDEAGTFGETVPDTGAEETMDAVEDGVLNEQLHAALESAMNEIPLPCSEILRMRFYEGRTLGEISRKKDVSVERVRQLEAKGINLLRKAEHACKLYPFYEFDFYCGTSLKSFKNSGMSVQEKYLIIMEDRRKRAIEKQEESLWKRYQSAVQNAIESQGKQILCI